MVTTNGCFPTGGHRAEQPHHRTKYIRGANNHGIGTFDLQATDHQLPHIKFIRRVYIQWPLFLAVLRSFRSPSISEHRCGE
jgi:hypothetical protein